MTCPPKDPTMRQDTRLSRMLHMLIHIALHDGAATSQTISQLLGTNAVVVRRMMTGLRERGYVSATKGPGGGWKIERPLDSLTVLDVYNALGSPSLVAVGDTADHPSCPVEQTVIASLGRIGSDAERMMLERFAKTTLADLARQAVPGHGGVTAENS